MPFIYTANKISFKETYKYIITLRGITSRITFVNCCTVHVLNKLYYYFGLANNGG